MKDNLESYSTSLNKIHDLHTQLLANVAEIEVISENIDDLENQENIDVDILENLYRNEFFLYMDNVGIYEDLIEYLDKEPKTMDNEFELARIRKDADKLLRVAVVEMI